jgi:hypothetical protein
MERAMATATGSSPQLALVPPRVRDFPSDVAMVLEQREAGEGPAPCAAPNDTLPDDGGDPQTQALWCREVSPAPARIIGDALLSMVEESSPSPSALAMDDGDDYDIQDLADAFFSSPAGALPTTPMRSPSPKKKRKYSIGLHLEKVGSVDVNGIPNNSTVIKAQTLALLVKESQQLRRLKERHLQINVIGKTRLDGSLRSDSRRSHGRVFTQWSSSVLTFVSKPWRIQCQVKWQSKMLRLTVRRNLWLFKEHILRKPLP